MLENLRQSSRGEKDAEFDLLIIGGGATGAGVALDAAARGLKVALVERDDFSSGTSSKSTKLVHGGVRYLQKAIFELDYEQYKLVREALQERKIFLHTAPYLSNMLPIMLPVYTWWQLPYDYAGCRMYDILAGHQNVASSYLMGKTRALEAFPMLKSDGLVGAVVYYDGQHNDSRMNVALIMSAVKEGATIVNHAEVTGLLKAPVNGETSKLYGARVRDALTGEEFNVHAKGVVNATGPFSDALLKLDNPSHKPIVQASSGIHITLPGYFSPRTMGLLDPATSDGRVIFFLPWQGNTIAGTTDSAAEVERDPKAAEEEVRWVLDEVGRYLSPDIKVRRGDVLAAWSGLRPLVSNPNSASTQALVRSHLVHVSPSGLLTIAGGKWTTYRAMAEETVDRAVKEFGLNAKPCTTKELQLVGSSYWDKNMFISLIQRFGIETEVAKHLSDSYGDRAWTVCEYLEVTGERWPLHGIRLAKLYPFIEAEARYAVHHEYALTATDFLARRSRLAFLNAQMALDVLPRVVEIMSEELGWDARRREQEIVRGERFLESMGLPPIERTEPLGRESWLAWGRSKLFAAGSTGMAGRRRTGFSRAHFEAGELDILRAAFNKYANDTEAGKGAASEKKINKEAIKEVLAMELASQLDGYRGIRNSTVEKVLLPHAEHLGLEEFLNVCASLKDASYGYTTAGRKPSKAERERRRIPVEKSGGGV